jgi:hypothetical protein
MSPKRPGSLSKFGTVFAANGSWTAMLPDALLSGFKPSFWSWARIARALSVSMLAVGGTAEGARGAPLDSEARCRSRNPGSVTAAVLPIAYSFAGSHAISAYPFGEG